MFLHGKWIDRNTYDTAVVKLQIMHKNAINELKLVYADAII